MKSKTAFAIVCCLILYIGVAQTAFAETTSNQEAVVTMPIEVSPIVSITPTTGLPATTPVEIPNKMYVSNQPYSTSTIQEYMLADVNLRKKQSDADAAYKKNPTFQNQQVLLTTSKNLAFNAMNLLIGRVQLASTLVNDTSILPSADKETYTALLTKHIQTLEQIRTTVQSAINIAQIKSVYMQYQTERSSVILLAQQIGDTIMIDTRKSEMQQLEVYEQELVTVLNTEQTVPNETIITSYLSTSLTNITGAQNLIKGVTLVPGDTSTNEHTTITAVLVKTAQLELNARNALNDAYNFTEPS